MSKLQRKVKVVIVGGGVSGLGVAQKLCESGIRDFILLEAQSVLGGRVSSKYHGNNFLEYGAHWIHGEVGNVVYNIGKENFLIEDEQSLKQSGIGETLFVREDGSQIPYDYSEEFSILMANFTEESERYFPTFKESIGSYYEQKFKEKNKWGKMGMEMLDWYGRLQCSVEGTNTWFDLSGIGSSAYKECPGNQVINWSNGYEKLLKKLEESVPRNNIKLNSPVRKIYWKTPINSLPEIELASGERIKAEHVVITASLGVLKAKHEEMFDPQLPLLKIHAIEGLEIGVVDKIFIEFSTRWWEDTCDGFNFLHNVPCRSFNKKNWEKGILGFYEVYKNPKILCGWLVGEAAKAMEECSLKEVSNRCVNLLHLYLDSKYNITEVIWCDRSKWYTNPYTRGSYSYHPIKADDMNVSSQDLASPIYNTTGSPILCFAGEATHECYFSTVHGALESGWREAKRIIEYLSRSVKVVKISNLPKREYFEVVIVGAGAAGLCAARELEANGFNSLLLLEAADRIGGRINTVYFPSGKYLEFGAQWIHGQHNNILYDTAAPRGLISPNASLDGEGDFYTEEGAKISPDLVSTVMDFYDEVKEEARQFMSLSLKKYPPSVGHYFKARFDEYMNNCEDDSPYIKHLKNCLFNWIIKWERVDNACDSMHQLHTLHFGLYSYCTGLDNLNPKKGMSSIIKSLAGDVNAKIRLNAHVDRINYSSTLKKKGAKLLRENGREPVIITCRDGSIIECQHVIVTSALGYLKRHLDMFEPALPEYLTEAVRLLGFGTINKIFLDYNEPWWGKDCIGHHIVWSENNFLNYDRPPQDLHSINGSNIKGMKDCWYKSILGFDIPYGNKSALCGWIGGLEAEYMETLSEEEVGDTCTWILRKFINIDIPKPKSTFISRWASDPLTFGSYSHRMTLSKQFIDGKCHADDLNHPVFAKCSNIEAPILTLAGEANSLNFYSTIHGAMESGKMQASHYINYKEKRHLNGKL